MMPEQINNKCNQMPTVHVRKSICFLLDIYQTKQSEILKLVSSANIDFDDFVLRKPKDRGPSTLPWIFPIPVLNVDDKTFFLYYINHILSQLECPKHLIFSQQKFV